MRVTDQMIFQNSADYSARARERVDVAQAEVSTGLRVQSAGDDPAAAAQIVGRRVAQKRMESLASSTSVAAEELTLADSALQGVNNVVVRATEIATQMSNATNSAADRQAAAQEVRGLLAHTVGLLNSKSGSRYLFAGDKTQTPPFDAAGNYSGDAGQKQIEVAPNVFQAASVRADVAIKGVGGGVDVLGTLTSLASALAANDPSAVNGTLTNLVASTAQVASTRAAAGINVSSLRQASSLAKSQADAEIKSISTLGDADFISAASSLAFAQRALDASLTASSQAFRLTLLDKLR